MALFSLSTTPSQVSRRCRRALPPALLALAGLLLSPLTQAQTVKLPNGEYTESSDDLSVKALGGAVTITRSWTNNRWYVNPAWASLKFVLDPLDNSVQAIDRAGSYYQRTGTSGVYLFGTTDFIKKTDTGWRWYDPQGNWITYDSAGRITAYGNPNNVQVSFVLDPDGTRRSVKDHLGHTLLTFTYQNDLLTQVTDYSGRSVSYHWTGTQLDKVIDVRGQTWQYQYDGNGQITARLNPFCVSNPDPATNPDCGKISLRYAQSTPAPAPAMDSGKAAAQANTLQSSVVTTGSVVTDVKLARVGTYTDELGATTLWNTQYDKQKQRYTVTTQTPDGVTTVEEYDATGRLLASSRNGTPQSSTAWDGTQVAKDTDARGLTTITVYNERQQPTRITYPDGSFVTYAYDVKGNQTAYTDEINVTTTSEYDGQGNLIKRREAVGTDVERVTAWAYDSTGQRLSQTANYAKGQASEAITVSWTYDDYGNVATVTDGMGKVSRYTYNALGQAISVTDALGRTTTLAYDGGGLLTQRTGADGKVIKVVYDAGGRQTKITDPLGRNAIYAYNVRGQLLSQTLPNGDATTYVYDASGRQKEIHSPGGLVRSTDYDADGQVAASTDPVGNKVLNEYGSAQNGLTGLLSATQYPTYRETYNYDQRNRVVGTNQILSATQTLTTLTSYNSRGEAAVITDPAGNATLTEYDSLGRVLKQTDSLAGVTRQTWDAQGNRLTLTDANGNTHQFQYDKANRLISETRPLGGATTYAYDDAGQRIKRTDAAGNVRAYTYDLVGRLITETHTAAGQSSPEEVITYTYNDAGEVTSYQQVDAQGAVISQATYTLDALGRATGQTITYGSGAGAITKTLSQTWNADGQKASFTYPDGSQTNYAYHQGQLQQVSLPNGQSITWNGYQWNAPTQISYPGAARSLSYDALLRPTTIQVTNAAGQTLMNRGYQYDAAGNITQRDSEDGPTTYGYDKLYRLTQVNPSDTLKQKGLPQEGYAYDAVHNRTTSLQQPGAWVYNADNQLLQWGLGTEQTTLTYTATGHTETETKNGSVRTYRYNAAERLTQVLDNGITIAQYQYDPFGRRIAKTANGQTIWFLYGDNGLVAEMDAQGNMGKAYGWAPNSEWGTEPLWQAEVSATQSISASPLYILYPDHLGTPQVAASVMGAQAWKGVAEVFGRTSPGIDRTITMNLRFPGQYFDGETGAYYNYFRDYRSEIGRYGERDPIGLYGGVNVYAYAKGNPLAYIDSLGLVHWDGAMAIGMLGIAKSGLGGSALKGSFTLRSDCVKGKRGIVSISVNGFGFGVGMSLLGPVSISGSTASFEDGLSDINPKVFEGQFHMLGVGTVFYSILAEFRLGRAVGNARGWGLSTDIFSVFGGSGVSKVINQRVECCK